MPAKKEAEWIEIGRILPSFVQGQRERSSRRARAAEKLDRTVPRAVVGTWRGFRPHLASEILAAYQSLDAATAAVFFNRMAAEFSPRPEEIGRAAEAYRKDSTPENLVRLQRVVESPRQELFRRLNMAPGATRILVEMRARLLKDLDRNPGLVSDAPPIWLTC